jgi:hexosaminidase
VKESTDRLFWADPWSPEGQAMAAELRPMIPSLRLRAERAIRLLAEARAAGALRENDAVDAIELGARRLDFIGQKFETADQIAQTYRDAYSFAGDPVKSKQISRMLVNISWAQGFCQDLRDGYSFSRSAYSALWLKENRPYSLQNVLARYDLATQLWIVRGDRFIAARSSWMQHRTLPAPAELGIPGSAEN